MTIEWRVMTNENSVGVQENVHCQALLRQVECNRSNRMWQVWKKPLLRRFCSAWRIAITAPTNYIADNAIKHRNG
ncbi:MAG: hypothetical protein ABJO41_10205 [Erythrobacter sp.]